MIFRTSPWKATLSRKSPTAWRSGYRTFSTPALDRPVQSYISTSNDPCLNLSIEHHLLQKSSPESAILFLYVNRPSIIIGRNQNPWLEVNLALLNPSSSSTIATRNAAPDLAPTGIGNVDLVRRRSGGGTVFHDSGNVNWTVISPSAAFTRDKHAEMVVRALRSLAVDRSRVNERHDVVLDQGFAASSQSLDPVDTHATPYQVATGQGPRPLKVSGSAYKLTRARALHHGTCLLSSPNLNIIPHYLHSPAKPFITARGVESVSSPVGNIGLSNEDFISAVREQFGRMFPHDAAAEIHKVGDEWLEIENVRKGYDELMSPEWTYLQTPQFTCSSEGAEAGVPPIDLTVRYGAVTEASLKIEGEDIGEALVGKRIHEIGDWEGALPKPASGSAEQTTQRQNAVAWLEKVLGRA